MVSCSQEKERWFGYLFHRVCGQNIKYTISFSLCTMPFMKIHSLGKTRNPTFRHYEKVLTEQSERHYIEREGRGKTRTLRSRQRDSIVQKQVLITKHKPQLLSRKKKQSYSLNIKLHFKIVTRSTSYLDKPNQKKHLPLPGFLAKSYSTFQLEWNPQQSESNPDANPMSSISRSWKSSQQRSRRQRKRRPDLGLASSLEGITFSKLSRKFRSHPSNQSLFCPIQADWITKLPSFNTQHFSMGRTSQAQEFGFSVYPSSFDLTSSIVSVKRNPRLVNLFCQGPWASLSVMAVKANPYRMCDSHLLFLTN